MSDNIKARLRDWPSWVSEESATTIVHLAREAADRIEALEAEVERLRSRPPEPNVHDEEVKPIPWEPTND